MLILKNKRITQLHKLLISYILLMLIVFFMLYPLYNNTLEIVKDKALKECEYMLNNSLNSLDTLIEGVDQTIFNLYTNADIKDLSMINGMMQIPDYYKMLQSQRHLNTVFAPFTILQDVFVIFRNNNCVITARSSYDSKTGFYQNHINYEGQSTEQWFDRVMGTRHKREFWSEHNIYSIEKGNCKVLTYMISLPINSMSNYDSVAGVIINKNSILDLLISEGVNNGGWIYVQDMYGNVILQHNYNSAPLELSESGRDEIKIGKENTVVIYKSSMRNGFKIVKGIPESVLKKSIDSMRIMLIVYYSFAMLCGIIAAVFFAYRNSSSVRKLISYIENVGFRAIGEKNEYESIKNVIDQLYSSKEKLKSEIESQQKIVMSGMLERLLHNGMYTSTDLNYAKRYLLDFPSSYRLVIMKYSYYMHVNSNSKTQEDERSIIRAFIISILKETYCDGMLIHPTGEYCIAIVLPQVDSTQQKKDKIEMYLKGVRKKIMESIKINTVFSISSRYSGMENVGTAFHEAQQILAFGENTQERSIVWYEEPLVNRDEIQFGLHEGQKLYYLLLAGENEEVVVLLQGIISKNDSIMKIGNKFVQQLFYAIRGVFICANNELSGGKVNVYFPEYSENVPPEQLFSSLIDACYSFCEEAQKRKRSHNNALKDAIISYINSNYQDSNIFAKSVADKFDISEKYLFNFIREQTGKSFREYLEDVRLEHALQLLKETSYPINQIALDVGFISQNSFSRVFKKVYGISPSIWRITFNDEHD